MGLFSSKPKSDPIKDALCGALKSVSLFSDQELEYFSEMVNISPTGSLARYISKGKYHARVTLSYIYGNLSIDFTYDPIDNRQYQHDKIRAAVASYRNSYEVTLPAQADALTDACFRLTKSGVSPSTLQSVASRMASDAASIVRSIGSF